MRRKPGVLHSFLSLAVVSSMAAGAAASDGSFIDFGSERWAITNGRVVEHLGRESLAGAASLAGIEFTDGIIEVDIAMDGRRCFPGILFRAESEADTEIVYLRPHRSQGYSHALQYAPRFRGLTGWQLYSGPGFTTMVEIPLERWVHLRIEVLGDRARVFFDTMERPALVIDRLQRTNPGGFVALTAPPDGRVHFSNFRLITDTELDFGVRPIRPAAPGDLTEWRISSVIPPSAIARDISPFRQGFDELEWRDATADGSGLVDIARFLDLPPRLPGCVVAHTTITSEAAEQRKLLLGYSDEVSVFLNDELLFRGDSSFRVRDSEFMGVVGLHDSVVLNLERGPNRLAFVVTESFGGWGFTARTEPLRDEPIVLAEGVEKVWELREGLAMPESAAWDPEREIFYVSNMNPGSASGASAGGYVVRVHADGHALEGKWVEGLRAPTGIAVHGSRLYAVERPGVVVVDLDSGEIIERRAVEATGGFLNDLAVVDDQTLFISDSASGVIYRWKSGEVTRWLEDDAVAGVNGLVVDAGRLVATAMGSENLVTIDLETGRIERIVDLQPFGGDGVVLDGRGGLLVSDYRGRLLRITPSGAFDQLIDARDAGISLTDFAFAPTVDLVAVPTLRGGALLGFRLGAAEE